MSFSFQKADLLYKDTHCTGHVMHDIVNCCTSVSGEGQSFYENVARERAGRQQLCNPTFILFILVFSATGCRCMQLYCLISFFSVYTIPKAEKELRLI